VCLGVKCSIIVVEQAETGQDFGAFASGLEAAWTHQQQQQPLVQGFGAFQQPSLGLGQAALGSGNVKPSTSKLGTSMSGSLGLSLSGPLNPAASQPLGGPSKSKDPFADLAAF
jgi:hypothetical protein